MKQTSNLLKVDSIQIGKSLNHLGNFYYSSDSLLVIIQKDCIDTVKTELITLSENIDKLYSTIYSDSYSTVVKHMLEEITKQFSNPDLTLKRLAQEIVYMNKDYLGKQFKKETGLTFTEYLVQVRMQKAKEFLAHPHLFQILEVADMVGYRNNPAYFSRVFKKFTGVTPLTYQRESTNEGRYEQIDNVFK